MSIAPVSSALATFLLLLCHYSSLYDALYLFSSHNINNNKNTFRLRKQYIKSCMHLSSAALPLIPDIKNVSTTISISGLETITAIQQSNQQLSLAESPELMKKILIGSMLAVGIPSIAACIVEPLLTIVDTIFTGKLAISVNAGVIDLAAMSINNAIFNILAAATAPLCTGTTNLVSLSQGQVEAAPIDNLNNNITTSTLPFKSSVELLQSPQQLDSGIVLTTADMPSSSSLSNTTTSSLSKSSSLPNTIIHPDSYAIFLNGLIVSVVLGFLLNIFSLTFGTSLIQNFFHPDMAVLSSASQYFKIRMLSFPFTLMNYIIVGFSLATQNIMAPILSILTSLIINVVGDYFFIKVLKWGLTGAAVATSISSVIGTSLATLLILRGNKNTSNNSKITLESTSSKPVKQSITSKSVNSSSNIKTSKSPSFIHQLQRIIKPDIIKKLFSISGLLLVGSLLNTLTYSSGAKISSLYKLPLTSVTTVASAATAASLLLQQQVLRTNHIAAHQVVMQIWWFLSYFSSPLCLIAQALLPQAVASLSMSSAPSLSSSESGGNRDDIETVTNKDITTTVTTPSKVVNKAQLLTNMLLQLSLIVATMSTAIVTAISLFLPNLFTDSLAIQNLAQSVTWQSSLSQFLICLTTAVDGLFIGTGILLPSYVRACFFSTLSAWLYYMYAIYKGVGLVGAWNGLVVFGAVRCLYYASQWKQFVKIIVHGHNSNNDSVSNSNDNKNMDNDNGNDKKVKFD